jgi:probable F420-dependent oxidoreductase
VKFGVGLTNYGPHANFDDLKQMALAAERLGYDSIWTTDHILVPRENKDPYGTILESLTVLAMVASLTTRVKLGTSVLVLPMRNPVIAAKQIATIDAASKGRVILGVAVGWNEPEYENLGADFKTRGKRLDEEIRLLRTLWSNEHVSFQGKYMRITDGVFSPPPAQGGQLPIWIGGNGEPSFRRAAELGDGWQSTGASPEQVAQGAERIRELGSVRPITISARLSIDFSPNVSPTYQYRGNQRYRLTGGRDAIRARLREYAKAGAEHIALFFPADTTLGLSQMEQFARELLPEFV